MNAIATLDTYSLPRMHDFIDSLGENRVFTALEALWRYWQVSIKDEKKYKSFCTSHLDTYRYTRVRSLAYEIAWYVPTRFEYYPIWSPTEDVSSLHK